MTRLTLFPGSARSRRALPIPLIAVAAASALAQGGPLRTQAFDRDPGWDGHYNRSARTDSRTVKQDFGWSPTRHAGGVGGEIGGLVTPAAEPARYALPINYLTFEDGLVASGRIAVGTPGKEGDGGCNTLIGFFNSDTAKEWRTPNSVFFRVNGRGDVFHAHVEYCSSKWRAGGDVIKRRVPKGEPAPFMEFPTHGTTHRWSLRYDPKGGAGRGEITLTVDQEQISIRLEPGHRRDGIQVNRFGILNVMKSVDGGGSIWLDDLSVNGIPWDFERDPGWEGRGNRTTFKTSHIRPRFDFGYSNTRHAGGMASGEVGGLFYRGDCRYPNSVAAYGDRLQPLDMRSPLHASGRVVLRRGVTDSTVLLGFYNARDSLRVHDSQSTGFPESFLGMAIEGPSSEGFFFYPCYHTRPGNQGYGSGLDRPRIYPDGVSHSWSMDYDPAGMGGQGLIRVVFDGKAYSMPLLPGHKDGAVQFDRFGFVTTWVDGNGQEVYLDDLQYTGKPAM